MNEDASFLAEIIANPQDDFLRLVYADWLEERGDLRAEFLRVQCEIKKTPFGSADFDKLHARRQELRPQMETSWLEKLGYNNKPLEIRDDNFDGVILQAKQPALVQFWAPWSGPCRRLGAVIDELTEIFEGFALIGKIDVEANQEMCMQHQINTVPLMLFFKDGEVAARRIGVMPKTDLVKELARLF